MRLDKNFKILTNFQTNDLEVKADQTGGKDYEVTTDGDFQVVELKGLYNDHTIKRAILFPKTSLIAIDDSVKALSNKIYFTGAGDVSGGISARLLVFFNNGRSAWYELGLNSDILINEDGSPLNTEDDQELFNAQ